MMLTDITLMWVRQKSQNTVDRVRQPTHIQCAKIYQLQSYKKSTFKILGLTFLVLFFFKKIKAVKDMNFQNIFTNSTSNNDNQKNRKLMKKDHEFISPASTSLK